MNNAQSAILVVVLPFFFVGMWCAVCLLLSVLSGWRRLAEHFAAHDPPSGKRFSMQSGQFGLASYGNCLTIYASPEGLYISILWLFRLGHRPLFIPWEAIQNAKIHRFFWVESVAFDVGSPPIASLRLPRKLFLDKNIAP